MVNREALEGQLVSFFEQDIEHTAGSGILKANRRKALNLFKAQGLPTRKHEEWKYTNLLNNLTNDLKPVSGLGGTNSAIPELDWKLESCLRFVIIDGALASTPAANTCESGLIACSLVEAAEKHARLFEAKFGKLSRDKQDPLAALNSTHSNTGVFVHLAKGISADQTVLIDHYISPDCGAALIQPRNLLVLEAGSTIQIIERYHHTGEEGSFINQSNEIYLDRDANLRTVTLQDAGDRSKLIYRTEAALETNSQYSNNTFSLSGKFIRNNHHVRFNGEHAYAHLGGLYLPNGNAMVDNHVMIDHAQPNCESNQLFKGILDGHSTGVFNGKIFVREDAQKTAAYQSNKNILLSDNAAINSKPQLEIFADDVKCSHGATSGQLDKNALFYLQARGVSKEKAQSLLIYAFALELVNELADEQVREELNNLLKDRLAITF